MNENDTGLYFLVGLIAFGFLVLLLFGFAQFINEFSQELKYLNNEIGRTSGEERQYWIRRRRQLWLSLIPFVKY